ncbi:TadE/TadG family type IV pilus assembly protein [Desulfohalovibrio reitneri]|uniref:TadE/TadG family type IV pilus assembly protein n=1 Tax=Desulfohalovibrio reitneri TaxID=1307759 RepID=UPI000B15FC37|nr:TadE/TadG family type IV pilus assembly protein [Desulfohalovibrio reitneri]
MFRLHTDQRGVASLILGLSLAMVVGFTALAVDVGYMHMEKARLQTAADSAALAGVQALISAGDDHAEVRDTALAVGRANLSQDEKPEQALQDGHVSLLKDGVAAFTGANQVEVTAGLAASRGNALNLFFGPVIGRDTADIRATARAGLSGACSSRCVKPFSIPTKFAWDDTCESPGSSYYRNGEMDSDSACEKNSIMIIGYGDEDVGTQVTLKPGDPSDAVVPSHYNLINLPPVNKGTPVTGASEVRENIRGCEGSNNQAVVEKDDELQLEPGNTTGPTKQGVKEVLSEDPYATWDDATNSIQNSLFADPHAESPCGHHRLLRSPASACLGP